VEVVLHRVLLPCQQCSGLVGGDREVYGSGVARGDEQGAWCDGDGGKAKGRDGDETRGDDQWSAMAVKPEATIGGTTAMVNLWQICAEEDEEKSRRARQWSSGIGGRVVGGVVHW
ncbi:hypothetical protein U1Q18_007336, partial [Sarracenia purpurea var. burkii]